MAKSKTLRYAVSRPIIGGVPQAVLTSPDEPQKPLLLVVHGGPGEPMTPFTDSLSGLEKRFVVCLWEQRGAGMSYVGKGDNPSIDQYSSDAVEVTQLLLKQYGRQKLLIMGFSWGTLVGLMAAAKAPQLFTAFIGVGQLADQRASEREAFEYALENARKAQDQKAVDFMQKSGPPPYEGKGAMKLLMQERTILRKYSDNPAEGGASFTDYFRKIFSCPYYTLRDKINFVRGMNSGVELFNEILKLDVHQAVPALQIPIYVMQGQHDMQTRPAQAQKLIEQISAPKKKLFLFEKAGHSPMHDDEAAFFKQLDTIQGIFEPLLCGE